MSPAAGGRLLVEETLHETLHEMTPRAVDDTVSLVKSVQ